MTPDAVTPDDRAHAGAAALERGELPPEALDRLQQLRRTGSWTSNLSVDEFAAVRSAGFEPVGQVMGATVDTIVRPRYADCGLRGRWGGQPMTTAGLGGAARGSGYRQVTEALLAARRRAAHRLTQECAALGGDGVVGVRLSITEVPGTLPAFAFTVMGTAVRARGRVHPRAPFLSDLSGQDFARLLQAGWVPCGLVFGVAIGVRHDDYQTVQARWSWGNTEVTGYTQLVEQTRADVRRRIADDVARHGGAGLVVQQMTLRVRELECPSSEGARDHVAEATLIGTAVTPLRPGGPTTTPQQVLRLDEPYPQVISTRLTNDRQEHR